MCEIVVDANTRKVEIIQKKPNNIYIYIYNDFENIFNWKKLYNIIRLRHNTCSFYEDSNPQLTKHKTSVDLL